MKKLLGKIKDKFSGLSTFLKAHKPKKPAFLVKLDENPTYQKILFYANRYSIILHIPLSLFMCFLIEWISRRSWSYTIEFVTQHTGAYLYNSFLIFVFYTLCYLWSNQIFTRMLVTVVIFALGLTNGIVLSNRVTPFGFTDMYMISDLLTMQDTNYFTAQQAMMVVIALVIYIIFLIFLFIKGKRVPKRVPFWIRLVLIVLSFCSIAPVTMVLRNQGVIEGYFGNLQKGYYDNGFLYGFGTSVVDRGMSKPFGYSEDAVAEVIAESEAGAGGEETTLNSTDGPNIIVVLLESVYDVSEVKFMETSQDPMPYLHYLEENYSTGHLTVPVVGAGTCNSEFEVLTGMSCTFFGPGEYPQKTILKETDCESVAADLKSVGYSSHVVHNNGGNFYSRKNAFSMMGFDTFQSKEMLDITDYTPLGSWPTDDILIDSSIEAMASTEGSDFLYTITVECHGDYPKYQVEEDPAITVTCEGKDEGTNYAWEYYVNRLYNEDDFVQKYVEALEEFDEPTILIMFGDHLPTMGLTDDEVETGDLYQTKYFTWNNFGMEKEDKDLTSYQLVSEYLSRLGFHEGTMVSYNQTATAAGEKAGSTEYMEGLEMLQYDLLYGKRYAYEGGDDYPASIIEMGIDDVVVDRAYLFNDEVHIYGKNFTKWSKVYVNGTKVATTYNSGQCLTIKANKIKNGDTIEVCQVGSSDTIFRTSNAYTFNDVNYNYAMGIEDEE